MLQNLSIINAYIHMYICHSTLFDGLPLVYRHLLNQYIPRYMYVQVLLREEETKMALDDADIKAVELDAQKALLEQVGTASNLLHC